MNELFHVQPLLADVFNERDLLDFGSPQDVFSAPAIISSSSGASTPPLGRISQFVSGTAAAATRRTTGRNAFGSPSKPGSGTASAAGSPDRAAADKGKIRLRCSAGYANNVYIGSSDGQVLWYSMEPSSADGTHYVLRNRHTLFPRRALDKIFLLPRTRKICLLAEGTLHFLSLPTLDPCVPAIPALRGVVGVALDDQEMGFRGEEEERGEMGLDRSGHGNDMNMCVLKRDGISLYRIGIKLYHIKDIPVPLENTPKSAVRSGLTLCLADPNLYCVLDLQHNHLMPLVPIVRDGMGDRTDHDQTAGGSMDRTEAIMAVIPGEEVFLVCTHSEDSSIGIFVDGNGDAIKGTVQWDSLVKSLVIEADSIVALLRNGSIVVHSLAAVGTDDEGPRQILATQTTPQPRALHSNPYGVLVPNRMRDEKFKTVAISVLRPAGPSSTALMSPVMEGVPAAVQDDVAPFEPPSGSGFSPPSSPPAMPPRGSSLTAGPTSSFASMDASSTSLEVTTATTAEILLLDDEGISAVIPTPWVVKGNTMIDEGKLHECVRLLEEQRRRAKKGEVDGDRGVHALDLRLLYTRLALCYLSEASFEESGSYFTRAKIDPRLVIRLFPHFVGNSIQAGDEINIWQGYQDDLDLVSDVSEVVERKIDQIFGHDRETRDLAETRELTSQLNHHASTMLLDFLRKIRASRRKSSRGKLAIDKIDIAVDTCLAKLLAQRGEDDELLALLQEPNACLEGELDTFIDESRQAWLLSRLMLRQNRVARFVEIVAKIADNAVPDQRCPQPQVEIFDALRQSKDPPLIRKYALWLVERDMNAGLTILMSQDAKTGVKFDDRALIADLARISPESANRYLEHVVVHRRSVDKDLHNAYVKILLDECEALASDDGVLYHFQDLHDDYLATRPLIPYCQYLAETAHDSPAKTTRLKTILFLQGSPFYDLLIAESRLEQISILFYELAIVLGRLGRHEKALRLLALRLGDSVSAETYCTQGGEVLPLKIARQMTKTIKSLEPWAVLGELGRRRKTTIGGEVRESLVMELLKVYMSEGEGAARQTAALLNAQALHLNVTEVLDMVPNDWSLAVTSDFVCRALKRQMHTRSTWQILKAISAGQNLQTSEAFFEESARHAPVLRSRPDGPTSGDAGGATSDVDHPLGLTPPDEGSVAGREYHSMFGDKGREDDSHLDLRITSEPGEIPEKDREKGEYVPSRTISSGEEPGQHGVE